MNLAHTIWRGSQHSVLVALNARGLASDAEWRVFADDGTRLFNSGGEDMYAAGIRSLAISDGGAPSSQQRREVHEVMRGRPIRFALVSGSRFARGVATAIGWLQHDMKTFAPQDFRRAIRWLEIPDQEFDSLWAAIREANARIGLETVAEIERVLAAESDVA